MLKYRNKHGKQHENQAEAKVHDIKNQVGLFRVEKNEQVEGT